MKRYMITDKAHRHTASNGEAEVVRCEAVGVGCEAAMVGCEAAAVGCEAAMIGCKATMVIDAKRRCFVVSCHRRFPLRNSALTV